MADTTDYGSLGWQLNNPGVLLYDMLTIKYGSTGYDTLGNAYFDTYAKGRAALKSYITSPFYGGQTVAQALTILKPAEKGYNPDLYAATLARAGGFDPYSATFNSLTSDQMERVLDAIQSTEGWSPPAGYSDGTRTRITVPPGTYF